MSLILLDSGSGSGGAGQDLAASATGAATVSSSLKVAHHLIAAAADSSTVTVTKLDRNRGLSATIAGVGFIEVGIQHLAASLAGSTVVSAAIIVAHKLKATSAGICTVTASLSVNSFFTVTHGIAAVTANLNQAHSLKPAPSTGSSANSAALSALHRLSATSAAAGTITSNLNLRTADSATSSGSATVIASLGQMFGRGADSRINMIAEYQRLVGILMLIDPSFITELSTPPTAQTFNFVKKVVKGLYYIDTVVSGSTVTCQVKTGDGVNHSGTTNVAIRTIATGSALISVSSGTAVAGAGTNACWVQSDSGGAFQISVSGIGDVLVEFQPDQGVMKSAALSL